MTVINYLYTEIGSRSPLIEIKNTESELFIKYIGEFTKLEALGKRFCMTNISSC